MVNDGKPYLTHGHLLSVRIAASPCLVQLNWEVIRAMFRLAKLRQDWQLPTGYWWTYLSNRRFSAVGVFLQQTCGWKIEVYKNHRGNRNWLVIVLHYPAQNLFVDLVPNQQFFFNNPFETQMPEIENLWKIFL